MADNNVQLDLYLNAAPAEKQLDTFVVKAEKAGKDAGEGISKNFSLGMASIGKAAAVAAAAIAATVVATMYKATQAAIESENSVKKLNAALRLSGDFSEQASQQMQDFASRMQSISGVSDEAILDMISYSKALGATNAQAMKISETAINMSKVLGVDAQTATEQLTKSLNGSSGKLSAFDSQIKGLTESQLKSGAAVDILAQKFAGGASTALQGFSGGLTRLSVGFGEVLENIGKIVTKSPVLGAVINKIADWFFDLSEKISDIGKGGDIFKSLMADLISVGGVLNTYLIAPLEIGYSVAKSLFLGIVSGVQTAIGAIGFLGGKIAELLGSFGVDNGLTQGLLTFAESSKTVMVDAGNAFGDSLLKVGDTSITDKLAENLTSYQTWVESIKAANNNLSESSKKTGEEMGASATAAATQINQAFSQSLVNGISNATQRLGAALGKGSFAFKDFRNMVLDMIADMAINIGKTLVAIGIGIQALSSSLTSLTGGAAIAAGVALIALGGFLKSFSSGAMSAAATSGGGVASAGEVAAGGENAISSAASAEQEDKGPRNQVTLQIMGDVLDSEASSLRIVDLLNNALERQGATLRTA